MQTYERHVVVEARQRLGITLEEAFYRSYHYFWERPVKADFIQRKFRTYLNSEEQPVPEELEVWALAILAGRIDY
jgi:hypothetical protein